MPLRPKSKNFKTSPPSKGEAESKDICFTIMPFGGWFDDYYETIYQPAIKAAGLVPRRADDLYGPNAIVRDVWELTKKAKIVLAELTGKNPNVFYELGLAHALAKPAILVTQTLDDIPFDLQHLRVIVYDRNGPKWGDGLKESIQASIKEVLASPADFVLAPFLQVDDSRKPSVTSIEKELIALRQDVDQLKRNLPGPPSERSKALWEILKRQKQGPEDMGDIRIEFKHAAPVITQFSDLGDPTITS